MLCFYWNHVCVFVCESNSLVFRFLSPNLCHLFHFSQVPEESMCILVFVGSLSRCVWCRRSLCVRFMNSVVVVISNRTHQFDIRLKNFTWLKICRSNVVDGSLLIQIRMKIFFFFSESFIFPIKFYLCFSVWFYRWKFGVCSRTNFSVKIRPKTKPGWLHFTAEISMIFEFRFSAWFYHWKFYCVFEVLMLFIAKFSVNAAAGLLHLLDVLVKKKKIFPPSATLPCLETSSF